MEDKTVKEKLLKPILILLLIIVLMCAHFSILAVNIVSYALEGEADSRNVSFKAYFETDQGEKTKNIEKAINSEDISLNLKLEIKNEGFIKNGEIELKDSNFRFKHKNVSSEGIESVDEKKITLKQINSGEKLNIKVGLELKAGTKLNTSTFNNNEKIMLKGKYINAKQKEDDFEIEQNVKISLTSPYKEDDETIDLSTEVITNKTFDVNGERKKIVQLLVKSKLVNGAYPIKKTNLEIKVPEGAKNIMALDRGTMATNGKKEGKNNEDTLKIKKNGDIINVEIMNPEESERINYRPQETDNIIVTCEYDEQRNLEDSEIKTKSQIELYDEQKTKYEKENVNKIEEEKENIVNYETISQSKLYKGKVYSKEKETIASISNIDIRYPRN